MALVDLHSAAASGDLARLRQRWWLNKYRINGYNREQQTPLHLACINGHAVVVQFLVNKKCKLNPCDKLNKTPLMKAVEHQHRDCAAILLEHGANHNHRSVSSDTALHFAVMACNKSLVELLLEHGADIDAKNKLGYTPLTLAITKHCEEIVKFLLQKGADMNAQDNVYSIANEQIGSSCYETTPVIPLETPALAESCDVSTEEAAEKKDNGPAADQKKMSVRSITVQLKRDILPAAAAEVKKEDGDFSWGSEHLSDCVEKMINPARRPAGKRRGAGVRSVAEERGKGLLQLGGGGTMKKEDTDSPWDSEDPLLWP